MAKRGRRVGIGLLVILVIALGLLVVADRVSASFAEQTVAEKVSQEVDELGISASPPDVTVGGFPFLTQVLDGRYDEVTILLRDVSANGLTVPSLDVRANGVNASMDALMSGQGSITADTVTGTATVGYDSVRALVNRPDVELSSSGGKLRLRLPLDVRGQRVTALATGTVTVTGGVVRVAIDDIAAEGVELPAAAQRVLDGYKDDLGFQVRLPPLPFQLKIESVTAQPEGLAVTATATDVPLAG